MQASFTRYPMSPEIAEWVNWNFGWIEKSAFDHWRRLGRLTNVVDAVQAGRLPRYAANSAIRDHNEQYDTNITFEEVRDRSSTFVASLEGDPVAYLDSHEATRMVMNAKSHDFIEALLEVSADVSWILLWFPADGEVIIMQSPHTDLREAESEDPGSMSDALSRGERLSYTLPPELEASLGLLSEDEILNDTWRREDAR